MDKLVITGISAISCAGNSVNEYWNAISEENSKLTWNTNKKRLEGRVQGFNPERWINQRTIDAYNGLEVEDAGRAIYLGVAAAKTAVADAKLEQTTKLAIFAGQGMAMYNSIQSTHLNFIRSALVQDNCLAGIVAKELECKEVTLGVGAACATGAGALHTAYMYLTHPLSECDIAIVCAADTPLHHGSYGSSKEIKKGLSSERIFNPFSSFSGTVLAEGAGAIVLEKEKSAARRKANKYCTVEKVSVVTQFTNNLVGITSQGYKRAMRKLNADPYNLYVNAHGTGTKMNDGEEQQAIRSVFGDVPSSSFKGIIGHTQAASAVIELVGCCGIIAGNIDLNMTSSRIKSIVKNSAGFNGVYSSALLTA